MASAGYAIANKPEKPKLPPPMQEAKDPNADALRSRNKRAAAKSPFSAASSSLLTGDAATGSLGLNALLGK